MSSPRFEPFQDRLSRDIRNALSAALPLALAHNDLAPVRTVAARYLHPGLAAPYVAYIEARLAGYALALTTINRTKALTPLAKALVLWDLELFFEVHEILEQAWRGAHGVGRMAWKKRSSRP